MPIFRYNKRSESLKPVTCANFQDIRIGERNDIQRLLYTDIKLISKDLLVITEEFSAWENSLSRIDLLCLDRDGCPVVVEIKRDEAKKMELQAVGYKALLEYMQLNFDQIITAYQKHQAKIKKKDFTIDQAKKEILEFLNSKRVPSEKEFQKKDIKMILVASNFPMETLITIKSQIEKYEQDIRCFRFAPYSLASQLHFEVDEVNIEFELKSLEAKERFEKPYRFTKEHVESAIKIAIKEIKKGNPVWDNPKYSWYIHVKGNDIPLKQLAKECTEISEEYTNEEFTPYHHQVRKYFQQLGYEPIKA